MTLTEIAPEIVNHQPAGLMARLSPAEVAERAKWVRDVTRSALVENTDYGIIPGTDKPALLKPGAEMLLLASGLGFTITKVDDEDSRTHQGVTYRCTVHRGDVVVAECDGYAGYDESRFYTSAEDAEKKERANAARYQRKVNESKFTEYRAPWNSVIKMAQKRALVGAALNAVAGSGLFTQDIEDEVTPPVVGPAFDAMALISPFLDRLDPDGKKELSAWRKAEELPSPSQMTPDQAARSLVKIGELLARQPAAESEEAAPAATDGGGEGGGGQVDNRAAAPPTTLHPDTSKTITKAQAQRLRKVDNRAAAPPTTLHPDTSKTITKAQAQRLRKDLGRGVDTDGYGLASADQDDLIYVVTEGRTSHSSDLTVGEEALLRQFAGNIRDGRMTLGDVHRAAEEHRAKTMEGQLEQSLAGTDDSAAVRDFDERTGGQQ